MIFDNVDVVVGVGGVVNVLLVGVDDVVAGVDDDDVVGINGVVVVVGVVVNVVVGSDVVASVDR